MISLGELTQSKNAGLVQIVQYVKQTRKGERYVIQVVGTEKIQTPTGYHPDKLFRVPLGLTHLHFSPSRGLEAE